MVTIYEILALDMFLNVMALIVTIGTEAYGGIGFAWLNPIFIYNKTKVNWFGAALLATLGNIVFLPYALFYWLYKLCTVGRR